MNIQKILNGGSTNLDSSDNSDDTKSEKSNILLIVGVVFVLIICCIIGFLLYKLFTKKTEILNLGKIIQKDEIEISAKTIPFANIPSIINKTDPVSYTMSFDCYIESIAPTWRNIFNNGTHDCCDPNSRVPAVFISGNDAAPANRIHIVHGAKEDFNLHMTSNFNAPLKQWFNITFTVDNKKMSTYFNGVADNGVTGTFNWGTVPPNNWKWNQYIDQYKNPLHTVGSVKVKNVVFWNKSLTDSQLNIILKE